jgi:cytochrome c biogenesis protein CcdA
MLRLLGLVLSIGLADSLNPTTIAPALYLAGSERPRRRVIEFTLAVFAVFLLGGALVALGPGEAVLALVPRPGPTARYVLEAIAGAAMLLGGLLLWRYRRRLSERELPAEPRSQRGSAILGAGIAAVELPTAFPYFAVIVAVVGSGLGLGRQLLLLVIYNLCFVLPQILIVVTLTVAPKRAEYLLGRARDVLQAHWPAILAGLAVLAGLFVLLLGITGLAGRGHGQVGRVSRKLRGIISR